MKNKYTTLILIIIFSIFSLYQHFSGKYVKVLNIITPTIIEIDTNGNNILDDGERFCLPDIKTFTSNLKYYSEDLERAAGITYKQAIAMGYMTDEYAKHILNSDNITLEISRENSTDCRKARILIGGEDYETLLISNGYALKDGQVQVPELFKALLEKASKLDLVLLNHHSQKYHTLDCKYGKIAEDTVVLLRKEVSNSAKPCQFCLVKQPQKFEKRNTNKQNTSDKILSPPYIAYEDNVKLILTDFTTILKPNNSCTHDVCREFVKAINSANESIDIAMYGCEDIPAIVDALTGAENRGVKIRIVYDIDQNSENYYNGTLNFVHKFVNAIPDKINDSAAQTEMLMHNKFAIFDNKVVYTGSMNFSFTGLSGFNHNNVVIIYSTKIAQLYKKEFEQMYSGKFHLLKTKSTDNTNIPLGNSIISVYFSPQDKSLSTAVAELIKNSKNYVYIPTFLFTHNKLTKELIDAKSRGVDVKIIIDATSTARLHSLYNELKNSGIPIKVENYAGKMHAKTMIIDDEYLILGSTNFSNSGENKNDENLILLKNKSLTKFYKDYFLYFWQRIPDKYLKFGAKPESTESIGSCSDGVDNNFDGEIDAGDNGCK